MDTSFNKSTGWSLIIGSALAIGTMALHPAGGNLEHIIQVSIPLKIAHTLAIFSLPFILFGFYGLKIALSGRWRLSVLAFIITSFGLIAAMLAALFNGLVLPSFLESYYNPTGSESTELRTVVNYGFVINKMLDYVFIVALCVSVFLNSVLMIIHHNSFKYLGYFGIFIFFMTVVSFTLGLEFTSLINFRIFVLSVAAWILFTGRALLKHNK